MLNVQSNFENVGSLPSSKKTLSEGTVVLSQSENFETEFQDQLEIASTQSKTSTSETEQIDGDLHHPDIMVISTDTALLKPKPESLMGSLKTAAVELKSSPYPSMESIPETPNKTGQILQPLTLTEQDSILGEGVRPLIVSHTNIESASLGSHWSAHQAAKAALPELDNIIPPSDDFRLTTQALNSSLLSKVETMPTSMSVDAGLIQNVTGGTNLPSIPTVQANPVITNHPDAAINITSRALVEAHRTKSGISVRLDPPEMGRVSIDFQFERDGSVKAVVRSEVLETVVFLKDKSDVLQTFLKEQGISNVDLSFQHQNNSDQQSDRNFDTTLVLLTEQNDSSDRVKPNTVYSNGSDNTVLNLKL